MDLIIRHLNFIGLLFGFVGFMLISWKVFFPNKVTITDAFGKEMYKAEAILKTTEAKLGVCLVFLGYILRVFDYMIKNF